MDFSFTEEQEALRELARKILSDRVTPDRQRAIECSEERVDRELWGELARANLLGAALPESFGGSGFGFFELCLLLQEVGRAVAPVPVWPTLVLGAFPLAQFGSEEQRGRWLPPVVAGDAFLSAALVDEDADDPAQPTARAEGDGRGWRLSGTKTCVPAAHLAARLLVPARTDSGQIGVFLIDPEAEGVRLEPQIATNRERQARVTLTRVPAGRGDVLGDLADGAPILGWLLERAVAGLCAMQVGVAERALRMTADYGATRKQFDRPIGSFQAVHQRAADAYIDLEAMRLTLWQAALRLGGGARAPKEVAVAKFWACEGGHRVAYAAQHLHGGIGVDVDYPIHRYYLWARQIELTLGSAAQQLARLGDALAAE